MRRRWALAGDLRRGWPALAALALAAYGFAVAQAARRATAAPRLVIQIVPPRAARHEAAHDAGAALRHGQAGDAPTGATGTAALPPLPVPVTVAAALAAAEPGVVAARPFTGPAGAVDRARALQCLADAIYYEAGGEPEAGQRAVAQVVLNRVRHPAFPATVCGVVYQGADAGRCQYSFACDGATARAPAAAGWARAARIGAAALAGYVYAPVGLATHYHSYAVTPAWNRALVMTDAVGAHLFHRWKGYWGTAAAFAQIYAGGEPPPGPRPVAAPPPPRVALATVRSDATAVPMPPASEDHLPPASAILPRWRESGTLR